MTGTHADAFRNAALEALDSLFNAALRMTGNRADAQDLLQDTYLQAFEHSDQLADLNRCRGWLCRIMRNRFLSLYRRRRASPERLAWESDPEFEGATRAQSSDSGFVSRREIDEALRALSPEFRTALVLADLHGFSYQEIAEMMGCPIGTVRSRIARARAQLLRERGASSEPEKGARP